MVGVVQHNSPFCQDGAMINFHVAAQQVEEYIPLVSEAGSRVNIPAIANVGNSKFEVHSKHFIKDDSILQWQRAGKQLTDPPQVDQAGDGMMGQQTRMTGRGNGGQDGSRMDCGVGDDKLWGRRQQCMVSDVGVWPRQSLKAAAEAEMMVTANQPISFSFLLQ